MGYHLHPNEERGPNLELRGTRKCLGSEPWRTQWAPESVKICLKMALEIGNGKDSQKVGELDPPEPPKVGLRVRGVHILTKSANPSKVTKKRSRGL